MKENKKKWKSKYAIETAFDGYDEELGKTIELRAKYPGRAKGKPMAKVLRSK